MAETSFDILRAAEAAAPEAVALRREIHRHPEMGNEERRTSELVCDTLEKMGWEISRPVGTSVVALLRGGRPGKTVVLRADMDALRIQEATGLSFSSEIPGVMHACGHDFHTAALLGAARVLSPRRDAIKGNVKLFFQPDEEGSGGAQRMIDAGCLDDPKVDAVFGAHVDPDLPAGVIGIRYGKAYAASDVFRITVHGAGCHGASPEAGIDPIAIGAQVVTALQQIVSRRTSPTDSAVVTVGSFHAGEQVNVIPDRAIIGGILRTLGPDMRANVREQLLRVADGVCEAMGARAEIEIRESYPGVVNWDESCDLVRDVVRSLLGPDRVRVIDAPTMGTEDFGCFIRDIPGAFYKIGVRNPEIGATQPIHSPRFIADEAAMAPLIAVHVGTVLRFLEK